MDRAESYRQWRARNHDREQMDGYRADIGPVPPKTISGEPLEPLYAPSAIPSQDQRFPGLPPFQRGIHPGMYRQRLWTFRQYAGFGSAAETNARYHELLASGQTGLSVAFDLPTQLGMDPDDPRARAEIGRVGVSIASVADMERLFKDIDLSKVSTSMTINAPAIVLLAFYQVVAERQGLRPDQLRGTVQNDILKEYAARNNYIFPPAPSMDLTVDVIDHCAQVLSGFYPISISGYHVREAGCTAPQEIAFTLANGLAYLEASQARGLDPERVGEQISFFFAATTELLEEVAKFRAARKLWASLLRERFGIKTPKALQLRFHVQTAGSLLTGQQPENNLVRVAIHALAGVLGGCQSLHTNAFDEALGLPTAHSAKLALMTQQILAFETGVAQTVDPLAGSYCVEAMTNRLESEALELMTQIEAMGGARAAIEAGFYQKLIAEAAFRYQREVERRERLVVGVNIHTEPTDRDVAPNLQKISAQVEQEATASVTTLRKDRDANLASVALKNLTATVQAGQNRMPAVLEAARALCTVGEICGVLRKAYGDYRPHN